PSEGKIQFAFLNLDYDVPTEVIARELKKLGIPREYYAGNIINADEIVHEAKVAPTYFNRRREKTERESVSDKVSDVLKKILEKKGFAIADTVIFIEDSALIASLAWAVVELKDTKFLSAFSESVTMMATIEIGEVKRILGVSGKISPKEIPKLGPLIDAFSKRYKTLSRQQIIEVFTGEKNEKPVPESSKDYIDDLSDTVSKIVGQAA
ncbi:hypothetical protein ACFL1T_04760, partial [Chlamydiota bacterium]